MSDNSKTTVTLWDDKGNPKEYDAKDVYLGGPLFSHLRMLIDYMGERRLQCRIVINGDNNWWIDIPVVNDFIDVGLEE